MSPIFGLSWVQLVVTALNGISFILLLFTTIRVSTITIRLLNQAASHTTPAATFVEEYMRIIRTDTSLIMTTISSFALVVISSLLITYQNSIGAIISAAIGLSLIAGKFLATSIAGGFVSYYTQKVLKQRESRQASHARPDEL